MKTSFTTLLRLKVPIMQAPIGNAAGPELAAAVANAGALGSLTGWVVSAPRAAELYVATRKLTDGAVSMNFRADLDSRSHIANVLDCGARLIHLFWGDPSPYAKAVHGGGALLLCTVSDADETKRALDAGADILIAQGWEAGGHVRGQLTTVALVPTVVDLAGEVPVLAAGGVVDGRRFAATLLLGAAGVVMGTRFVACDESRAHPDYKRAVAAARQTDAVYVENLFDGGWSAAPHRVLRNSTVRAWEAAGRPGVGDRPDESGVTALRTDGTPIQRYSAALPIAGMTGAVEALALYAGQGVEQINDVRPAHEIIEGVMREAREALATVRVCSELDG